MRILLTEEQLSKLISEELGIADKVSSESKKMYDVIVVDITKHKQDFVKEKTFSTYTGSFSYRLFDIDIVGGYTVTNYYDKIYADSFGIESTGSSYYLGRNTFALNLYVPCVSGTIVKSVVMDTIQHELEHIYQQTMMKRSFGDTKAYNLMRNNFESDNPFVSKVARLVYGCMDGEQEGYVNGMYAYIIAWPGLYSMLLLKRTPCYKLYKEMCETFDELSSDERFDEEIKQYGLTKNKIRKALRTFGKRIARTAAKAKRDKTMTQNFRI